MKPVAANIKLVDDSISYTPAHISKHLTTSSGELKHMGARLQFGMEGDIEPGVLQAYHHIADQLAIELPIPNILNQNIRVRCAWAHFNSPVRLKSGEYLCDTKGDKLRVWQYSLTITEYTYTSIVMEALRKVHKYSISSKILSKLRRL